ncbi:MAG: phosphate acyltransferase [Faecousia sp.]
MHIYEKEFDFVIQRAMSLDRPARMVVAGADCENILKAVFDAEAQGFCRPILVGNEDKIKDMLQKLGLIDRSYTISHVPDYEINTDYHVYMKRAIDIINDGLGDVLVRGNTSTRNFLMPILDKKNGLTTGLVSEVALVKVPYYDKVLALSDTSVLINPSEGQRKKVIKNLVYVLNHLGIERPKVAVLALVEKPSFHMRDTVEAQNIVRSHKMEPIADCELAGPIPWDLIVSKEAARLKNFDCPYCGEFDAVLMPNVMAGNTVMKVLSMSAANNACGVLAGTKVPVAIASRSSSEEHAFLSLCVAAAMLYEDKKD